MNGVKLLITLLAISLAGCEAMSGRGTPGLSTGIEAITPKETVIIANELGLQETPCRDYAKGNSAGSICQLARGKGHGRRKLSEDDAL